MSFEAHLFLKWIDLKGVESDWSRTLTGLCVLTCRSPERKVEALTVFEPRALNADLVARLQRRMNRADFLKHDFTLYLPRFLSHRMKGLKTLVATDRFQVVYTSFVHVARAENHFAIRPKLRVVNVDDSPVLLKLLRHCQEELGFIDTVTQVLNPLDAVETILRIKPDVVTMDIQMPRKTGVDLVRELLARVYFPVLMVSSLSMEEGSLVFEALNAGAFEYLQKPKFEELEKFRETLSEMFIAAAEGRPSKPVHVETPEPLSRSLPANLIWCLGASTGGTQALTRVLTSLPNGIPPILIVQHIPPVYSRAFAESLDALCPFKVKESGDGEEILSNHVYIAAGGLQMGVAQRSRKLFIELRDAPPVNRFKPSVDYLFAEVANLTGFRIIAGLMTGMGRDGAQGLLKIKASGARTFAQDERSSAVYGMPRAAAEIGAAEQIIPLDRIASALLTLSQKEARSA